MGINKGGWKLFYTTVKYHPGTVEVLISNKVLSGNRMEGTGWQLIQFNNNI
jgi:hypothetical protein